MPVITLKIDNKTHQIACQEGEESHLEYLAAIFSEKVSSLHKSYPNATDLTLYMMAALMICDELEEYKKKALSVNTQSNEKDIEEAIIKTIEVVTEHLDYIANKLDK